MSAKSATLAKSLHTVSAIVSFGRYVQQHNPGMLAAEAVAIAAAALGYHGAADPYGLAARAVAILAKDAPAAAQSGTLADCCPAAVLPCDRADYARGGR